MDLWRRVQREYAIRDSGGLELLYQICAARDRLAELDAAISDSGVLVQTRTGLKGNPALRDELACRAFIARSLARLGVTSEPLHSPGRPATGLGITWRQLEDK
jgi:hypothetical protein